MPVTTTSRTFSDLSENLYEAKRTANLVTDKKNAFHFALHIISGMEYLSCNKVYPIFSFISRVVLYFWIL